MSLIKNFGYCLSLSLLLVAGIGTITYVEKNGTRSLNSYITLVRQSNAVISKEQKLSILVERMLASRQGYALSGEKNLITRYEDSKAAASDLIAELSMLTQGDSSQISRLNEMQHYFLILSEKLDDLRPASKSPDKKQYSFFFMPSKPPERGQSPDIPAKAQTIGFVWNNLMRVGQDILQQENILLDQRMSRLQEIRHDNRVNFLACSYLFVLLFFIFNAYVFFFKSVNERDERNIDTEQEIFRRASEAASDGIFEWNIVNDKAFYSKQFWAMLGYQPDRFPGTMQSFKDLLHPEDRELVLDRIEQYLSGEASEYLVVFRMKHQSGRWVWINARGRALYNDEGRPIRIIGAHTDISPLKAYEEKLQKAKEHAENASRAKTDFLAHMSHEIRTPLTAISGIAEIFENSRDSFDGKQRQLIKILNSSTSSLKDLVSDILDFSKIESGELELEQKVFSLQDVFEQVISIVSLKSGEKILDVHFDYTDVKNQKFLGDRARLRQILINLIGNAIKFTDKGSVSVTAIKVEDNGDSLLRIDVMDTGIGIDQQNIEIIFERFKQADSSVSRKYGGTGLGLPISLRLARLMGGDITVQSTLGQGSVFTLVIPLKIPEDKEIRGTDQSLRQELAHDIENLDLSRKKILLVEDYEGNIVVLSYLLDGLRCHYDVARTGLEALNMWREKRYDLILMDVQMPEMDGFTATAQIRRMEQEKEQPYTPIIGMTAHALVGDKEKCIEVGMSAYLPKPIVELDLKAKIIEFLEHKEAA